MSILAYNGGSVVAMKGKNCVAIATDLRFGVQAQTITTDFERVFEVGPHLYIGLPGLVTDTQTVLQRLKFRIKMYEMREGRKVKPRTLMAMVQNLLYERRFGPYFVEPVIAGLDPVTKDPYICALDLIGCPCEPADFVVSGTSAESLYGMCETTWREDLEPDDLFECIGQSLINAFDRDALSGWGAVVHVIEEDKVTTRHIKSRMD
ncbi:proteasome subunit beta type-3-like [Penaeus indicus]|uniref:proteasome subunit beta type-3-like n=1 Tax=Penaeus chinensis TaxID=139456 RepID=UPI001FB5A61B|nr:proteasome subunit beta type-3-like [Penaeus chinensis]